MEYPEYPPLLSPEQLEYLLSNLKDWSVAHGLTVQPPPAVVQSDAEAYGALAITAPVTLFPSPFPASCFHEAVAIQKGFNELYAAISRDPEWLGLAIQDLLDTDDFIEKQWQVHLAVSEVGYAQDVSMGLFRSDYMVHVDPSKPFAAPSIKQIEFNTIASSFGGLSAQVSRLHKYLRDIAAYPQDQISQNMPSNPSINSISEGMLLAYEQYKQYSSSGKHQLCILFVVQAPERNVLDQRHIELALREEWNIPHVFRLPFSAIKEHTTLEEDRTLLYTPPHEKDSNYEVALLYYRAGYSPSEYPNDSAWAARLHLERSRAIKCPSILTQLAGCKKVQQVLASPSSTDLARFLHDKNIAARVQKTFANIYPLDESPAGHEAIGIATNAEIAHDYVLKPQREGGGNNIYGSAIPAFLNSLPRNTWKQFILMELIQPPPLSNAILRNGALFEGSVIGELGIFGVCLWKQGGEVLENFDAGYLLRTKASESEEGGVASGFGSVDSCLLVDT
ncbi:MAG: hypothetical protein M1829_004719 [Trizodia sp. TS-e1964]|nr:MAG: hypothetical protein M1829_004719 [Trizodia sp. TS-e1964]